MKRRKEEKKGRGQKTRFVWSLLKGSKALFSLSIFSAAVTALADMAEPQIIRMAVDNALGGRPASYAAPLMAVVDRLGGFDFLGQNLWIMALAMQPAMRTVPSDSSE